jgi:hypothetical protein
VLTLVPDARRGGSGWRMATPVAPRMVAAGPRFGTRPALPALCASCARGCPQAHNRAGSQCQPAKAGLGRECSRVEAHSGRVSRAGHGDRLTHRCWLWPPRRQARNRPGASGGYVPERPHPARGPALPAGPRSGVLPHLTCSAPFLPVVSEMTGPPPAVPARPDPERAGSWLAGIAQPAARELAAAPMRSSWPHPPATRAGAARHHAP